MRASILVAICMTTAGAAAAQDAANGAAIYRTYCATCHGTEARGDGPMAGALLVPPADLATMTERYGGSFPIERVVARIDGRDPLVSHGSSMPVYGDFFEGRDVALKTQSGQPILTSAPIVDLVAYLQSVQQ